MRVCIRTSRTNLGFMPIRPTNGRMIIGCEFSNSPNAMASLASSRLISSLDRGCAAFLDVLSMWLSPLVLASQLLVLGALVLRCHRSGKISRCPPRQEGLEPRRRNTSVRCGRTFGCLWGHPQDQKRLDGVLQDIRSADMGQPRCYLYSEPLYCWELVRL